MEISGLCSGPTSQSDGAFLVVDDEPLILRALSRRLSAHAPTVTAGSAGEALAHLSDASRCWLGFLFDIRLGEDSGLAVLAAARRVHGEVPALVLTAHRHEEYINTAFRLGAQYACKPIDRGGLLHFVARAFIERRTGRAEVRRALAGAHERHGLSSTEVDLLTTLVAGGTRSDFAARRGLSDNTARHHVRSLLAKTGARSAEALASEVLRASLGLGRD